jgi:hypothetical protein
MFSSDFLIKRMLHQIHIEIYIIIIIIMIVYKENVLHKINTSFSMIILTANSKYWNGSLTLVRSIHIIACDIHVYATGFMSTSTWPRMCVCVCVCVFVWNNWDLKQYKYLFCDHFIICKLYRWYAGCISWWHLNIQQTFTGIFYYKFDLVYWIFGYYKKMLSRQKLKYLYLATHT